MTLLHQIAELGERCKFLTAWQLSGGIDGGLFCVVGSPGADCVKVFQGETERIDFVMALGAGTERFLVG